MDGDNNTTPTYKPIRKLSDNELKNLLSGKREMTSRRLKLNIKEP